MNRKKLYSLLGLALFSLLLSCTFQTTSSAVEYQTIGILIENQDSNRYAFFQFYFNDIPILETGTINPSTNGFYNQKFMNRSGNLRVEVESWTTKADHTRISKTIPLKWELPPRKHPNFPLLPSIQVTFNGTDLLVEEQFLTTI